MQMVPSRSEETSQNVSHIGNEFKKNWSIQPVLGNICNLLTIITSLHFLHNMTHCLSGKNIYSRRFFGY